jgi:hypothetical protein
MAYLLSRGFFYTVAARSIASAEAATQLMLNGAEFVIVPNACTWDETRTAGLRTRAFENLVGIAMTNYPGLNKGSSQGHSCVAWRAGQSVDTLIAKAGEQEQTLLATLTWTTLGHSERQKCGAWITAKPGIGSGWPQLGNSPASRRSLSARGPSPTGRWARARREGHNGSVSE